jgi:hypothetical protein
MVFAADEYYLMAGRPFPNAETYEGFPQHENGLGMARAFEAAFRGDESSAFGVRPGFFAWVDGAPPLGYRAPRGAPGDRKGERAPIGILTGEYGAAVLAPLVAELGRDDIRVIPVANDYFGGNIGVSGLLTGTDLTTALRGEPEGHRYLLPDACLSEGRFLDDLSVDDLPHPVEVVATDGLALRRALTGEVPPTTEVELPARVPVSIGASR